MVEEIVEYKIMQQSSNGWFLLDDSVIHLTKEQAAQKWLEARNRSGCGTRDSGLSARGKRRGIRKKTGR